MTEDTQTLLNSLSAGVAGTEPGKRYAGRAWQVITYNAAGEKIETLEAGRALAPKVVAAAVTDAAFELGENVHRVSVREASEVYVYQLEESGMIRELELGEAMEWTEPVEPVETRPGEYWPIPWDDIDADDRAAHYDTPTRTVGYVLGGGDGMWTPVVYYSTAAKAEDAAGRMLDYNPNLDRVRVYRVESYLIIGR